MHVGRPCASVELPLALVGGDSPKASVELPLALVGGHFFVAVASHCKLVRAQITQSMWVHVPLRGPKGIPAPQQHQHHWAHFTYTQVCVRPHAIMREVASLSFRQVPRYGQWG